MMSTGLVLLLAPCFFFSFFFCAKNCEQSGPETIPTSPPDFKLKGFPSVQVQSASAHPTSLFWLTSSPGERLVVTQAKGGSSPERKTGRHQSEKRPVATRSGRRSLFFLRAATRLYRSEANRPCPSPITPPTHRCPRSDPPHLQHLGAPHHSILSSDFSGLAV